MIDITKLPDKWLDKGIHNFPRERLLLYKCAEQLQKAIPKWTKITDNPDTFPTNGQNVMFACETPSGYTLSAHQSPIKDNSVFADESWQLDTWYWRPRCDLDYPTTERNNDI